MTVCFGEDRPATSSPRPVLPVDARCTEAGDVECSFDRSKRSGREGAKRDVSYSCVSLIADHEGFQRRLKGFCMAKAHHFRGCVEGIGESERSQATKRKVESAKSRLEEHVRMGIRIVFLTS